MGLGSGEGSERGVVAWQPCWGWLVGGRRLAHGAICTRSVFVLCGMKDMIKDRDRAERGVELGLGSGEGSERGGGCVAALLGAGWWAAACTRCHLRTQVQWEV